MSRQRFTHLLTPEQKSIWDSCTKHQQVKFSDACKASGLQAGIDYLLTLQGNSSPVPTTEEVASAVLSPVPTTNHKATVTSATNKKLTALIPEELHARVMLHAAISHTSVNRVIAQLIADHVPEYEVKVKG